MSDMPGQDPVVPVPGTENPKSGIAGLLATPGGKVVAIGAALAVLLVVLGAVAAIVLLTLGKQVDTTTTAMVTAPTKGATAKPAASKSGEPTSAQEPAIPVTNRDVFTERDPFQPAIEPTPTIETTLSAEASRAVEPNTLTLQGIIEQNGVAKAVLTYNGMTYTAAAGEQLGDTPWKVLSVGKDAVTMLYGDQQVTLTTGEGVSKAQ